MTEDPFVGPHIVTNGTTFRGPFNDRESAYAYLIQQQVTGWRVEPIEAAEVTP